MFDVAPTELAMIAVVALVVIGPKDLPRVMRVVGKWTGKARAMAKHFRAGFDDMLRESELQEMEQKWREENERIMREHPAAHANPTPQMMPLPPQAEAAAPELPLPPPPAPDPKP
jgi:sec-independent protein translocase protein TatB